jgi:hypothetical protein
LVRCSCLCTCSAATVDESCMHDFRKMFTRYSGHRPPPSALRNSRTRREALQVHIFARRFIIANANVPNHRHTWGRKSNIVLPGFHSDFWRV